MATNALPNAPSAAPSLSLSAEMGGIAETAVGGIEAGITGIASTAIGIGMGIFVFKRGIEAIFGKNPFRPLFSNDQAIV